MLAMIIKENCIPTRMHVSSNRPVSEDEEEDDVFSRRSLYYGRAGQRMVFLHMYLQTRVTLKAFPIATPRGRSSKFPWRGTWLKKNFQHARIISTMEFSSVCFSTVFCYKENRTVIALAIYLFYIWLFILLIICIVNLVLWCSIYKDFSNVI